MNEEKTSVGKFMSGLKGIAVVGFAWGALALTFGAFRWLGDEFPIAGAILGVVMLGVIVAFFAWLIATNDRNSSTRKQVVVFVLSFVMLVVLAYGCGKACEPRFGGVNQDEIDPDRDWRPR